MTYPQQALDVAALLGEISQADLHNSPELHPFLNAQEVPHSFTGPGGTHCKTTRYHYTPDLDAIAERLDQLGATLPVEIPAKVQWVPPTTWDRCQDLGATAYSCSCPDRSNRFGGSYISADGTRCCKHMFHMRNSRLTYLETA